ncbi:MAG TPA: GNAT family N-acetyltransferase [Methylomusa anaerophila]|uniref:Putative phosphinothricin acetyltransferase YwnH n=1 Tax=Methylomusa anaerophila TaxID=1930071 RepID=A0A348AG39_9FIRM|nr:GNAT family N-acetyltransferase [Methylomusa anaerophila]BBB90037.1 putative phosphinothricin acetyltransferase YwnH [Methylomusa anaerophila]HML88235.1 GNAT family N-acetyltransferase [Methylomusa anaerophila]
MEMEIRKIEEKDVWSYYHLLHTLDNESKFLLFEPGERRTSPEELVIRIRNAERSGSLLLVVEAGGSRLVGFLSAERGFANRIRHKAYIAVGILEEYTGQGLGGRLFREVELWARNVGVVRLELTVMAHNKRALRLYEKMGFMTEGKYHKSLIVDGQYVDEYCMAKLL